MIKNYVMVVLVVGVFSIGGCSPKKVDDENSAMDSVQTWLTLADNGKYAECWEQLAKTLKSYDPNSTYSKEKWQKGLEAMRRPLGKVISRNLKSKQYHPAPLMEMPNREFSSFELEYVTSCENNKSLTESIATMKEKDGTWRVYVYYIGE